MEPELKKSNKKIVIIVAAVVAAIALAVGIGVIVYSGSPARRLQEQLDLGARYLSELDYEQAIAAYEAALEIDPKSADAYGGLIQAYGRSGNVDALQDTYTRAMTQLPESQQQTIVKMFLDEANALAEHSLSVGDISTASEAVESISRSGLSGEGVPDINALSEGIQEGLLRQYLEQVLIPEKGIFRLEQSGEEYGPHAGEMSEWYEKYGQRAPDPWHDATGIFCVDFYDYDGDNSVEMLVISGEKNDAPAGEEWLENYRSDLYVAVADYYDVEEGSILHKSGLVLEGLTFDGFSAAPGDLQIVRQEASDGVFLLYSYVYSGYAYYSGVQCFQNIYQIVFDTDSMSYLYGLSFDGNLTEYQYLNGTRSDRSLGMYYAGETVKAEEIVKESLKQKHVAAEWRFKDSGWSCETVYDETQTYVLFDGNQNFSGLNFRDHTGFHERYAN